MTCYIRTLPPLWVNNVRFFDRNTFNCELYIQLTKPNTDNTNDNTLIFLLTQGEKLIGHGFCLRDDPTSHLLIIRGIAYSGFPLFQTDKIP